MLNRRRLFVGGFSILAFTARDVLALGDDEAVLVEPEAREQMLWNFAPAGGPLDRHTSRPGAWYALLYLPLAPLWPMQLLLWPPQSRHELRLFALDQAPDASPSVLDPLPLEVEVGRGGKALVRFSRFMLPAQSSARSVFVLIEQWNPEGARPEPLWVKLLSLRASRRRVEPWWYSHDDHNPGTTAPRSPLTQQQGTVKPHEIPIFGPSDLPVSGVLR
jgi:hypothetical protein